MVAAVRRTVLCEDTTFFIIILFFAFLFTIEIHHLALMKEREKKKRAFCLLNQFNSIPLFVFRHLNEGECSGTV